MAPSHPLRILVMDQDRATREGCAALLRADGHSVAVDESVERARELLALRQFDLILIDLAGQLGPALGLIRTVRSRYPRTLVAVSTPADAPPELAIAALDAGAWEFVPKPYGATHLRVLVGCAAHVVAHGSGSPSPGAGARPGSAAPDANGTSSAVAANDGAPAATTLVGSSLAFQRVLAQARRVAATDASVMIVGESGTGKEMVARYIHAHSRRARHVLMPLNCAALPESLLESEMFGHRKGAFTGADRDKPGLLETAHGGTLFLDELTTMSHAVQAKLLRVLQDGRVRRVGSEHEDRAVDVRIISATNIEPQAAVRDGLLREDLFFRLWVFPLRLPPLRERPEDIAELADWFLGVYWARHRPPAAARPVIGAAARTSLMERPWPGNVRELQNAMERVAVSADPGALLLSGDIAGGSGAAPSPALPAGDATPDDTAFDAPYHDAKEHFLADFDRRYFTRLLERVGHNFAAAARAAGVDRTTLYRMLERHGMGRADVDRRLG